MRFAWEKHNHWVEEGDMIVSNRLWRMGWAWRYAVLWLCTAFFDQSNITNTSFSLLNYLISWRSPTKHSDSADRPYPQSILSTVALPKENSRIFAQPNCKLWNRYNYWTQKQSNDSKCASMMPYLNYACDHETVDTAFLRSCSRSLPAYRAKRSRLWVFNPTESSLLSNAWIIILSWPSPNESWVLNRCW
jgi:hypothetical protein